jgi:hypothetical protein
LVKVVDPFFVIDAKSGDAVLRLDFFDIKAEALAAIAAPGLSVQRLGSAESMR